MENPCDPYEPALIQELLALASKQVGGAVENFHWCQNDPIQNIGKTLEAASVKQLKQTKVSKYRNTNDDDESTIINLKTLGALKFIQKLGKGGYSHVYLLEKTKDDAGFEDFFADENTPTHQNEKIALKIQSPSHPWEFYIISELHLRLPDTIKKSIIQPLNCHFYAHESLLSLNYSAGGTVLDCINTYGKDSVVKGFDELLASFFGIEVMKIVESIHAAGITIYFLPILLINRYYPW